MLTEGIEIDSADGRKFGALVGVSKSAPGPVIVIAHEIFGVNAFAESIVDWLSGKGFSVICPDLYWRQEKGVELDANIESQKARAFELWKQYDLQDGVADLKACVDYARSQPYCNGKVGILGYCLGGTLAFLVGAGSDVDCSVGYYGVGLEKHLDLLDSIKMPAIFHMGRNDHFVPPETQALLTDEFKRNPSVSLQWYDAGHSFARPSSPGFSVDATAIADKRTLQLFDAMKVEKS
jgi:carboxymethylenebutenolidase